VSIKLESRRELPSCRREDAYIVVEEKFEMDKCPQFIGNFGILHRFHRRLI